MDKPAGRQRRHIHKEPKLRHAAHDGVEHAAVLLDEAELLHVVERSLRLVRALLLL